jgi:hypothetical protein
MVVDLEQMGEAIKTVLSEVPGIASAFDHEPQNMNQLPAATTYFSGFGGSDLTTGRKSYGWRWIIRIYIPMRTSDIRIPQLDIRKITVNVLNTFSKNPSIKNTCLYHTISEGEVYTLLDQTNSMMVAELDLTATTST